MSCPIKKALEEDLAKARSDSGVADGDFSSYHSNSKFSTDLSHQILDKGIQKSFSEGSPESKFTSTPTNSLPSSPAKSALRKVSYSSCSPNLSPGRKISPPSTTHVTFYGHSEDSPGKAGEDSPESSNYGSTECSPRRRKISNISTASSAGSELDSDSGERKVDLKSLIEGVGTVIIPAMFLSKHGAERYTCLECCKEFMKQTGLNRHREKKHLPQPEILPTILDEPTVVTLPISESISSQITEPASETSPTSQNTKQKHPASLLVYEAEKKKLKVAPVSEQPADSYEKELQGYIKFSTNLLDTLPYYWRPIR